MRLETVAEVKKTERILDLIQTDNLEVSITALSMVNTLAKNSFGVTLYKLLKQVIDTSKCSIIKKSAFSETLDGYV